MTTNWLTTLALLSLTRVLSTRAAFPDCASGPLSSNGVCDTSLSPSERATALIAQMTPEEKIANLQNTAPGVDRIGLPAYEWWSEALHGVARSPGVAFAGGDQEFSSATSFPMPILMGAAFDDEMIGEVAAVIGKESRAYGNGERAGLDFWTPNINPFKDPRWGRGQETPGEDPFHISRYIHALINGLEYDESGYRQIVATCKHYAAYDIEGSGATSRHEFNAEVTTQELSEYYLPPFKACADANVGGFMCSYNALNGKPTCADPWLLQTVLREHFEWNDPDQWITSDCGAVNDIYEPHNYTDTPEQAVAEALKAGTDLDCGDFYPSYLGGALEQGLIEETDLDRALNRLYSSLVNLGYFDPPEGQALRDIWWDDVNTPEAQALAYQAAVSGAVLISNDGVLPLQPNLSIALIGPWVEATTQMQGNYYGVAPYLVSPLEAAARRNLTVRYVKGSGITQLDATAPDALAVAQQADVVVYMGGIDNSLEAEGNDREDIAWPSGQADLLSQLMAVDTPLVVAQFGGGQVDDSFLLGATNDSALAANAILWAGYPGQEGGNAVWDLLLGTASPAGRLPVTQYPATYAGALPITEMGLRPAVETNGEPLGRTYMWYTGEPVVPFGHGLHYTSFDLAWEEWQTERASFGVAEVVADAGGAQAGNDTASLLSTLLTGYLNVTNTGEAASDYVALLFLSSEDAGPEPRPNRKLVSYQRARNIAPGETRNVELSMALNELARVDESGSRVVYPGNYKLAVDVDEKISWEFELTGDPEMIVEFPTPELIIVI
ncbi:beta-xylosidase [Lineolata rhizophorae]|uniref:xylan 1,4-beta-xylosidase n=1 Tax=Lineolata rhizophorae TaxID=578093 RepID=A0A6A6NRH5_9PEZI|nr:beta-xylosidase [Lineolata rhizophorae]